MKVSLKDLVRIADIRTYRVDLPVYAVKDDIYLRRLENVTGRISFYYGPSDELRIVYDLKGDMICPCAITLEDVAVPFDLQEDEKVVYKEDEDGFYFHSDFELDDLVYYIVSPEAPIKVVKNEKIEYSKGDCWSFVSETDYEAEKKKQIDPRLQKLTEYKFEEDD